MITKLKGGEICLFLFLYSKIPEDFPGNNKELEI